MLSKDLCSRYNAEHILVYAVASVGVKEAVSVCIGMQVERKGPRTPKEVDVAVSYAAVANVDKGTKLPTVVHHVGQTVITRSFYEQYGGNQDEG